MRPAAAPRRIAPPRHLIQDAYVNCGGLQKGKRRLAPLNALLPVASKPPTRRSVHIRPDAQLHAAEAAPQQKRNGGCRGSYAASRAFAAENNACTNPPFSVKQTFDTAAQRSNLVQNSSKSDTKNIKKTAQDTPWAGPTSTEPLPLAMWRR